MFLFDYRLILYAILISCLSACNDLSKSNSTFDPVVTKDESGISNPSFNDSGRIAWQKPELVMSKLGDLTDKVVADIGAGTGYFTFRLAPRAKKDHRYRY